MQSNLKNKTMLENVIKGWFLSALGGVVLVAVTLHTLGIYRLPNPNALSTWWECGIGLAASFVLVISPKTKLDEYAGKVANALFSLFKNKTDA